MLQELFRYYWNILKNGRNIVCSTIFDAPYGREELKKNQHWYGFTALALVFGLAIGVCGIWFWGLEGNNSFKPKDQAISICLCKIPPYLEPDFPSPYLNGKLALGTKVQVDFSTFKIPKPSPEKHFPPQEGIEKDREILDPLSDVRRFCSDCEFIMPEIPEPEEDNTDWIFDTEPYVTSCHFDFDETPQPINLEEITKLITYPSLLQREGGTVVLRILIDKKGRYKRHTVLEANNLQLLSSIEKHIGKLKFTPSIIGGRPIKFWVNVPFVFKALGETTETTHTKPDLLDQAEHLPPTPKQLHDFFSEDELIPDEVILKGREPKIDEFILLDQEPVPLNIVEI